MSPSAIFAPPSTDGDTSWSSSKIRLDVTLEDGWVVAEVGDDGRGFSVEKAMSSAGGLGLLGMRERAALVGGRVTIESEQGDGTRVRVALPAGASEATSPE